jgi:hypothetical protein
VRRCSVRYDLMTHEGGAIIQLLQTTKIWYYAVAVAGGAAVDGVAVGCVAVESGGRIGREESGQRGNRGRGVERERERERERAARLLVLYLLSELLSFDSMVPLTSIRSKRDEL